MIAERIQHLLSLKEYLQSSDPQWLQVIELAERSNGWFTEAFIQHRIKAICKEYLNEDQLIAFAAHVPVVENKPTTPTLGIVTAGNIPMVGIHDLLCAYLGGFAMHIKLSSKDEVLMKEVILKLKSLDASMDDRIQLQPMLKGCDAYLATGSNNSIAVFKEYFGKYPSLLRNNKTCVAVLTGKETDEELTLLADEVYVYFGLGCRNVTKLFVPEGYDFIPLLDAFRKYDELKHHNKYRNNYDYQLALYILNNQPYMSNESVLMIEDPRYFSPIAVLHYSFYSNAEALRQELEHSNDLQGIVGEGYSKFGSMQQPTLTDFADGLNTLEFFASL
jgi:hypothetical protein